MSTIESDADIRNSPIIGILCVDIAHKLRETYGEQFKSYIAASYVKFIESGGGRVVPIWIGKPRIYYENILKQINGVLLPGGAVFFHEENGFADAGKFIYEIACDMNEKGNYFPIFGICLGYELLLYASAGNELRQDCDSVGISLALEFTNRANSSRLFGMASKDIINTFANEKITYNYHRYCITKDDLEDQKIAQDWIVLSTNGDDKVRNYISTIEHKKYPFYGVQFHPERNAFEHKQSRIVHSANAIRCSNYLAEFFVNETRKNDNRFIAEDENRYLIYNFTPVFTYHIDIPWQQCYLFEENINYPDMNKFLE